MQNNFEWCHQTEIKSVVLLKLKFFHPVIYLKFSFLFFVINSVA